MYVCVFVNVCACSNGQPVWAIQAEKEELKVPLPNTHYGSILR